jgi:hypothetical protein
VLCAVASAHSDAERAAPPAPIESCVSRDAIAFRSGDLSAVLDDQDHRAVSAAMARLYPVVERDGMTPQRWLLWQKRGGETVYVALLPNPQKPAEACFTATFSAARFDMTPLLRRTYDLGAAPRD